ncbi:transcriptional regulator [Salmonella enterica subsp. enterica serovar Newport]|nr:transcriptional regulator [Salmonella enterica subsp. enterica serovar Newport]
MNTLLRIMLAPNRLAIINALTGQGLMSIRALTRKVERHYLAVYRDVQTLLAAGVIGLDDKGKLTFPYGEVRFNFSVTGQALVNTSPREAMP